MLLFSIAMANLHLFSQRKDGKPSNCRKLDDQDVTPSMSGLNLVSCREEKYRFCKRGEKEKKKRREREESDKNGDRTCGGSA